MRSLYIILRVIGYLGGLAGLILLTLGRRSLPANQGLTAAGAGLMLAGFLAFIAAYAVYITQRMARRPR